MIFFIKHTIKSIRKKRNKKNKTGFIFLDKCSMLGYVPEKKIKEEKRVRKKEKRRGDKVKLKRMKTRNGLKIKETTELRMINK